MNQSIVEAIQYLSSQCDGAVDRDGVGFNASDASWGKGLARSVKAGNGVSSDEVIEAWNRLQKYSKQLAEASISLPSEPELTATLTEIAASFDLWQRSELEASQARWVEVCKSVQCHQKVNRDLAIALEFLDSELGDFGLSLLSQVRAGNALTERQQKAGLRMLLNGYGDTLTPLGFTLTDDALEEFFAALELEKAKRPLGRVSIIGSALIVTFEYNPAIVATVKAIGGARWNAEGKFWQFPLSALDSLVSALPNFEFDSAIAATVQSAKSEALAAAALKQTALQRLIEAAAVDAPLSNGRTLYTHQKNAVKWALNQIQSTDLRGVILALDMGVGKTLAGLTISKAYQKVFNIPVFVICPASLKVNWQREAEMVEVPVEIFSWAKIPMPLETQEYVVIFDECHFAQAGQKSKRGRDFLALARHSNCKAAIALTGTPIKNGRPINLLPLLQACNHELAHKKTEFEKRYCAAKATQFCAWDTTGASHLDELSVKVKDAMLRVTKKECLDLPEKVRVMRDADVTGDRLKLWKQAYAEAQEEYEANRGMNGGEALVLMGKLRKAASIAKLGTAIEMAQDILEEGGQVVLFTEFIETAKTLHRELGGELLIGETNIDDRQPMVDRFQAGQSKVFVSTSRAGGVGITLTEAQTVILVDRPWTPGDAMQAEDRLHRIGQKNAVTAFWIQWSDIDYKIDEILEQKYERIELVLAGKRKTLRGIKSPADIAKQLAEHTFSGKKKAAKTA